jgi:hypothetical protein
MQIEGVSLIIFIMTDMGDLYTNIERYFEFSFIMIEVGILNATVY